jgi:hypothetical protein
LQDQNLKYNKESVNELVLILKPTEKAIKRVKNAMKIVFKTNMPIEGIISKLNPILRG